MRDLGALATWCTAPALALYMRDGRESFAEALADIKDSGWNRPREASDVAVANYVRALAWTVLMLVSLAVFIAASAGRQVTSPTGDAVLEGVMVVTVTTGMFCGGMMVASGVRAGYSQTFEQVLIGRLDVTPRNPHPRLGFLGWLSMPTNLDILVGLTMVSCFAPLLYP